MRISIENSYIDEIYSFYDGTLEYVLPIFDSPGFTENSGEYRKGDLILKDDYASIMEKASSIWLAKYDEPTTGGVSPNTSVVISIFEYILLASLSIFTALFSKPLKNSM